MSEIAEDFRALREHRRMEGESRRGLASIEFYAAANEAAQGGLSLICRSDEHYQITSPKGWLINFYPGNRRIYGDRNRAAKPPFLRLREDSDISLLDVVRAAVEAEGGDS